VLWPLCAAVVLELGDTVGSPSVAPTWADCTLEELGELIELALVAAVEPADGVLTSGRVAVELAVELGVLLGVEGSGAVGAGAGVVVVLAAGAVLSDVAGALVSAPAVVVTCVDVSPAGGAEIVLESLPVPEPVLAG
jgi:hypothetical protein